MKDLEEKIKNTINELVTSIIAGMVLINVVLMLLDGKSLFETFFFNAVLGTILMLGYWLCLISSKNIGK